MTKKELQNKLVEAGIAFKSNMTIDQLKALLPTPAETPVGSEMAMQIIGNLIGMQQVNTMMFMRRGDMYVQFSETVGASTYTQLLKAYRSALAPYAVLVGETKTGIKKYEIQIKVSDKLTVCKPYGSTNDVCHSLAVATVKSVQTRSLKFDKDGKATAELLVKVTGKEGAKVETTKLKEIRQKNVYKSCDIDFAFKFLSTFK